MLNGFAAAESVGTAEEEVICLEAEEEGCSCLQAEEEDCTSSAVA